MVGNGRHRAVCSGSVQSHEYQMPGMLVIETCGSLPFLEATIQNTRVVFNLYSLRQLGKIFRYIESYNSWIFLTFI